ncbi:MAG: T9SS type A sorting domain-containing protein [Candidatus Hydrothermales bacterium]
MIVKLIFSFTFIIQDTWAEGRDTIIVKKDTLKTFLKAFQVDPFLKADSLLISRDSLFLIPSSQVFDIAGYEVKGITTKSPDTLFVGVFHPNITVQNFKVFYTLDSLSFTSGRVLYDDKSFNIVKRIYFTHDYGNNLWIGSISGLGWIFYSNELEYLPPQNFRWVPNSPYASGHNFSDFLIFSPLKMYCSTNRGRIFRYLKSQNIWQSIYQFPSPPGSEPDAQCLFKTDNGLGIAVALADGSGTKIYETLDDVNFYQISPLLPSKHIVGGVLSHPDKNLIVAGNLPTACYLIKNNNSYVTFQSSEFEIFDIFKSNNGILYLLAYSENVHPKRRIYSSLDGIEWNLIESLDRYSNLGTLIPSKGIGYKKNEILIGTSYKPRLFKSKFQGYGYVISNYIKLKGQRGPIKIKAYKIKGAPLGNFRLKLRSFNNINDTIPFTHIPPLTSDSSSLENYSFIKVLDTLFQYKLELFTSNPEFSPFIDYIKIYYEEDTTGPVARLAEAKDGLFQQDGKDPDDHVIFIFNEPTSKLFINKNNVDSLLKLSNNHSWLNIFGDFGGSQWSTNGETLRVFLAFSGNNYPSVEPGDTVNVKMNDPFGFWRISQVIITGSFDDILGPKLIKAIAKDGNFFDNGISNGDSLFLIFNEHTNKPYIHPSNVDSFFYFKRGGYFGENFYTIWVTPETLIFIFTGSDSKIYSFDTIQVKGYRIYDIKGNPCFGFSPIEGSFDLESPRCDSILAFDNTYPDTSIDTDDFIAFYFSENIFTKNEINKININNVFKLSNNHSWLSGSGEIGNILIYESYIFVFLSTEGGKPTVRPGDTVKFLNNFIFDYYNNALSGYEVISGSFTKSHERIFKEYKDIKALINNNKIVLFPSNKIKNLEIYDNTGRKINFSHLRKNDRVIVNIEKKGVYFLIIEDSENKTKKIKFIKIK